MGRRDTLLLSILTLLTALAWIAFDVYHSYIDTTIPKGVEEQLVPITPTFDKSVVETLKKREKIDPFAAQVLIPTQSPTSGGQFNRTQTRPPEERVATQSGGL